MIGRLSGRIDDIRGGNVVLDVNGVGYEVACSRACIDKLRLGDVATLITYTEAREDCLRLHGFADVLEKQVFSLLLKVKGLGVKSAVTVLSHIDKCELLRLISRGDIKGLSAIRGIGKKGAERIVVELRDKVKEFVSVEKESYQGRLSSARRMETVDGAIVARDDVEEEAFLALCALGFSRDVAQQALTQLKSNVQNADSSLYDDAGAVVGAALKFI
jgi:Holliday junction DNA helicase RuvA